MEWNGSSENTKFLLSMEWKMFMVDCVECKERKKYEEI